MLELRPQDSESEFRLELFINTILFHTKEWDSIRDSDGVPWYDVLEDSRDRLRIRGKIWHISQKLSQFWLENEYNVDLNKPFRWKLFFDVLPESRVPQRHLESAVEVVRDPSELSWRKIISGYAKITADQKNFELLNTISD